MRRNGLYTIYCSPYLACADNEYHWSTYGEHVNTWDVIL